MRVHLCVTGRVRTGPELDLIRDYLDRFDKTGRNLGLSLGQMTEVEDRRGGGMAAEAALLRRALPNGAKLCVLDERGKMLSSPDFAALLGRWRDDGAGDAAFVIGGADGVDPALRAEHAKVLAIWTALWTVASLPMLRAAVKGLRRPKT